MDADPKLSQVISYLEAEFPGYELACLEDGEFETVLELSAPDQRHNVRVQRAFLEATPAEEIPMRLAEFRLAPTLRDLGDLPLAVTLNGCIFA